MSARKRAGKVSSSPKGTLPPEASEAAKARRRAAVELDALTQNLASPLSTYVRGFPRPSRLHAFERALLELTVGTAHYERTLLRVDALRKGTLELGKGHAGFANRANTLQEAESRRRTGFEDLEALFRKGGGAVDELKEIAKTLRSLPVAELQSPTITLVGAPNVGKSSLVRLLSSGRPEVQNYPFTTRGIQMGHIMVDGRRHVLTDTPGMLLRPDVQRNKMERLTLAALAYLPVRVMFVFDFSGGSGTRISDQMLIREELRGCFPQHPWLDVASKCDLPDSEAEAALAAEARLMLPDMLHVSPTTGQGVPALAERLFALLSTAAT